MTYPGTPTRINENGETEKLCGKCGEWWPLTPEFFGRNPRTGRLKSPCKACSHEQRVSQPCRVSGCTTPRWNSGSVYCREHYYQFRVGRPPKWQQHQPTAGMKPDGYWQRLRKGIPLTSIQFAVLKDLYAAKQAGRGFIALPMTHARTLRSMLQPGWIAEQSGADGLRYKITSRGEAVFHLFDNPHRRWPGASH